ncbi:PGF-CTERM sorting domain-containing protein [Methanohalophilus sp. RSK]|uniref:S-layer protein domain-containing protein n=1 Tax=Methanohalophilus sp. RSK TaxID=2485783 RepID=UPI000F43D175|nr:S-layer protein domain-containing protein [Methanohalophilus sp. RSK]RNI15675.1 PGF-CTERM sorting domain-containing protein [Methanohalophilus sp. RSK]
MKRLTAILMAALMVLTVFAGVASAADSVAIRGPIFDEAANFSDWRSNSSNGTWEINAQNFAGFWYDIDDGLSSETITIYANGTTSDRKLDEAEDALIYEAAIESGIAPEYNFSVEDAVNTPLTFEKIGFMAEEYVPIVEGDASMLSKLLMDDDTSYTIRTGEALELGEGYVLTPQQIDVDGNKVWLELTKDGEFIDDAVISTSNADKEEKTWYVEQEVLGEDVDTLVIHVDEVFQGQVDSLAVIEGIWQISDDAMEVEVDDEFGKMIVDEDGGSTGTIVMSLDESITLDADDTYDLMENLKFKVADDSADLRFYLMQEYTEPGTYEIRGTVAEAPGPNGTISWTANDSTYSFSGFWYDLDEDDTSETLNVWGLNNNTDRKLDDDPVELNYTTSIVSGIAPEYNFSVEDAVNTPLTFEKIGFRAEEYVPIVEGDASMLTKLLMDDDTSYTIRTGEALELGEGYAVTPQQIDVDGNKVWLELTKDGEFIDDAVISTSNADKEEKTWYVEQEVLGEDVDTLVIHVDEVFQGQVDSLAVIEGIWQISDDAMEIEVDDEFGKLIVDEDGSTGTIVMSLDESITLDADDTYDVTDEIMFKVADSDTLRFYPFVEKTIEGEMEEEPVEEEPVEEPEENVTEEEPVEEEPAENVTEEEPAENVTEEEPAEEEPEEEPAGTPGFEAVFAIAGLLAVAYLVRRN